MLERTFRIVYGIGKPLKSEMTWFIDTMHPTEAALYNDMNLDFRIT